jgi:rubrerythrin
MPIYVMQAVWYWLEDPKELDTLPPKGTETMSTQENLTAAFAGESQANRKYLAFAQKAEADGYPQVAKLFRAAAAAETVHAHSHLRVMRGVKSTAENLQAAVEGEGYEFREMYPSFLKQAQEEGVVPAELSFQYALAVEEVHHGLYEGALAAVKANNDLPDRKIFVCAVCGHTVYDAAPEKCPVCNSSGDRFSEIA